MKLYSEALLKLKTLFDQAHHVRYLYSRTLVTWTRKGTEKRWVSMEFEFLGYKM